MRFTFTLATALGICAIAAPVAAVAQSGYPVSGTISQRGHSVTLGYERGVCGPVNAGESVVCTDEGGVGGVEHLPAVTPGTMRVHLSIPVRVVGAGDRSAGASVHQLDPTDATVTFRQHVRPATGSPIGFLHELAWVMVERAGKRYRMLFDPVPPGSR